MRELSERAFEVLDDLYDQRETTYNCEPKHRGWVPPMLVGGTDASHHSATLRRLVKRGLAERRIWSRAYRYRISAEGIAYVIERRRSAGRRV